MDELLSGHINKGKLKRPSHVKLMLANSGKLKLVCVNDTTCWQTVGENRDKVYFSPTVCQDVVVSFTHTNLSLPKRVGQHKFDV